MCNYEIMDNRIDEMEKKIAALTKIVEEQLNIDIDLRSETEKFLDEFMNS